MSFPESYQEAADSNEAITKVAQALYKRFGRPPTTEEVTRFILGNEEERTYIWNFGLPEGTKDA